VTTGVGVAVSAAVGEAVTMVSGVAVGVAGGVAVAVGVAAMGMAVSVGVGVGGGVRVGVGMGVGVGVGVGLGLGAGVGVSVGGGVGVTGTLAVQSTVPVSQAYGAGRDTLTTPAAALSVGNEPLTAVSKMVSVNSWVAGSISIGRGNVKAAMEHVPPSAGTSEAVNSCTCDPSSDTVKSTVPHGGASQPVISPE
jgi:hypothetical protein